VNEHIVVDRHAAATLGRALRRVGYAEDAVHDLIGDDGGADDGAGSVVGSRRLPSTRLATVVRSLFLQLPVPADDAVKALGRPGVEALEATGFAEVGRTVTPRMRILPVGPLLVASDDHPADDREEPAEYVAAFTPTSQLLDALTPRRRVARALDVGTGSGVQALFAARHARHVVATDVNERALAYTELNAALNGFTNIECRRGSLFEPVAGERFDLVTCNAPYVVSPENRWAYRDGGLDADELSRLVVRLAAAHLTEGGFATLLVSWLAEDEDALDEHPLEWVSGIGCDSWILPVWGSDPLDHAATWNEHLGDDPAKLDDALDRWTGYLARFGTCWVSEGGVVLHRTGRAGTSARVDAVDDDTLEAASDQILRAFGARRRLAGLRRRAELAEQRVAVAGPLLVEHEIVPRRRGPVVDSTTLQLAEGTQPVVEGPREALELIASLDGTATLGEAVDRDARERSLSSSEASRLRRDVLRLGRELLELGALRFV
jgi:methylase of polypeptide subunit release factors